MDDVEVEPSFISDFQAVTNADDATAQFLLEASGGDFELALNTFFEQQQVASSSHPPSHNQEDRSASVHRALQGAVVPPRPHAPIHATAGTSSSAAARTVNATPRPPVPPPLGATGAGAGAGAGARGRWGGIILRVLGKVLGLPWVLIRAGLGGLWMATSLGLAIITFIGNRFLPTRITRAARAMVSSITQAASGSDDADPSAQARLFSQSFASSHPSHAPQFVELGSRQAMQLSRTQHKFTFVYLHAPEHEDSESFSSKILCDPALSTFITQNFIAWGGDVHKTDAHQLAQRLGVSGYPCVSLLSMANDSRVHLVGIYYPCHQEPEGMTAHELLVHLSRAVDRHGAALVAHRAEAEERDQARRLREEQDADYERSLQADQEREQRRREERERVEREEREIEEKEAKIRAEEEAARRRTRDIEETIERRRREAKASFENSQDPSSTNQGRLTALIRIRLPDGSNSQRRFESNEKLQQLFVFVDSLDQTSYLHYTLVCSFPRRVYTKSEGSMTLEEAGLTPQAALFVQPLELEE